MKKVIPSLLFILFITHITVLFAQELEYEYDAQDKFCRGIFNMLTSPLEIPIAIYKTSVEKNPIVGLLYGLPLGIGKGIIRLGMGAVELTTFSSPPYGPMLESENLFKKEKRD